MLAETLDVVIGVDTHKHTHTAAAVSPTGAVLDQLTVSADAKGYRRLLAFGERHDDQLWAIEGTGSFGAGLTTALLARSERVVEVDRPERPARRAGAKSDDIDAVRAARQVLAGQAIREPRLRRPDRRRRSDAPGRLNTDPEASRRLRRFLLSLLGVLHGADVDDDPLLNPDWLQPLRLEDLTGRHGGHDHDVIECDVEDAAVLLNGQRWPHCP